MPPRITFFRERQSIVPIGNNLTLTCNASGDPHPNITWTKQGATAAQFNATTGVLLHLVNVQRQDVGSYNCTADNGYGTPATNLAVVNVKCKCVTTQQHVLLYCDCSLYNVPLSWYILSYPNCLT